MALAEHREGCNGADVMPRFGRGEIMAESECEGRDRKRGGQDQNVMRSRGAGDKWKERPRRDMVLLHITPLYSSLERARRRDRERRENAFRSHASRSLPACLPVCLPATASLMAPRNHFIRPTRNCLSRFVHPPRWSSPIVSAACLSANDLHAASKIYLRYAWLGKVGGRT